MPRWDKDLRTVAGVALVLMAQAIGAAWISGHGVVRAEPVATSGVEQPQEPAREEFVPVDELPPEEQLPAAPFLIGAYAVAWVVIITYVWRLWRRLGRVEQELQAVVRAKGGTG